MEASFLLSDAECDLRGASRVSSFHFACPKHFCKGTLARDEFGGERASNRKASTQQIVDQASAFAYRVKEKTGRRCMLYGRGANRDRSITSKMGCDCVWNPSYTERMVTNGLVGTLPDGNKAPWTIDDIVGWQYGGDGVGVNTTHKLPLEIKGFGKIDLSVYIDGARVPTLASLKARMI